MTPSLVQAVLPQVLFRLGRRPTPCDLPPEAQPPRDRFDDPARSFRVLYAAEQKFGAILERFAPYRPNPALASELRAMGPEEMPAIGQVPVSEFMERVMAQFHVPVRASDRFIDLRETQTLTALRAELYERATHAGIHDFELERSDAIRAGKHRAVTQLIARWAFEQEFRGICYESRWDRSCTNWALFEPMPPKLIEMQELAPKDPDVERAIQVLGLRLGQW